MNEYIHNNRLIIILSLHTVKRLTCEGLNNFTLPPVRFRLVMEKAASSSSVSLLFVMSNGAIKKRRDLCASGYRNRTSGGLNNVGGNGNYWSAAANSRANAYNLNFNSGNVNPLNNNNRANGFSVRPSLKNY